MQIDRIEADVLIIGGGTAGCYAAITLARKSPLLRIVIAEKANIYRSGCLAAGVNALNAYINKDQSEDDYVEYTANDFDGIVRRDLLKSMAGRFNSVTEDLEQMGLVIHKDENGNYVSRGKRSIKINGENIKPLLADTVYRYKNIRVINHVQITDYLVESVESEDGFREKRIRGAVGFLVDENRTEAKAVIFTADFVICATGGAAGLYRPNNPGFSRHKMWYPPFNTGAGYAMGIRAGAEMTSFEMRFVALRCKDTIAPTGTIAQGVGARQKNSRGEVYALKYGNKTAERMYGTVEENRLGHGPCYLDTTLIRPEQEDALYKAYLNMAPSQTLRWLETGRSPSRRPMEIEGTEPYIVGGHTASGYWVDAGRRTTIQGLYAAGDVAGGAPKKYVTGALAEGEIAAESILSDRETGTPKRDKEYIEKEAARLIAEYERHQSIPNLTINVEQVEEAMQKVMDEYAGGITRNYSYNEKSLGIAEKKILDLQRIAEQLPAEDTDSLSGLYELRERLTVCEVLINHLRERKETRWHIYGENTDYPFTDTRYDRYINSFRDEEGLHMIERELS
ncbi:MAG: adenylyl-sulfate reductase subunit alpha [Eubacterium sp.]|nr:adenylyl-sulfate reductase subunit alpha [Eubacterium sp.]